MSKYLTKVLSATTVLGSVMLAGGAALAMPAAHVDTASAAQAKLLNVGYVCDYYNHCYYQQPHYYSYSYHPHYNYQAPSYGYSGGYSGGYGGGYGGGYSNGY